MLIYKLIIMFYVFLKNKHQIKYEDTPYILKNKNKNKNKYKRIYIYLVEFIVENIFF